ncbi:MAG: hypothetical protein KDJ52_30750 [Anaerolineae bacterium]|nr:hypothetical protein [Anaerolineae bacterium]
MSIKSYMDILKIAQQLPPEDQIELAEELIRHSHPSLQVQTHGSTEKKLIPLAGMSEQELRALARSVVDPIYQEQIKTLLQKNQSRPLSAEEEESLDTLLEEVDQVALLKTRALYTLKIAGLDSE